VAFATSALDGDGARVSLPRFPGFAGTLTLPPNDADGRTRIDLQTSLAMPSDAPDELRAALAAQGGKPDVRLWLGVRSNADARFFPGDAGFDFRVPHLVDSSAVKYYALACDRANCKARRFGPLFATGGRLAFSNADTPFHFHFNVAGGHEHAAVIFERRCAQGDCDR
jgi:hypothetical protein